MEQDAIRYWLWVPFLGGMAGWFTSIITGGRGLRITGDIAIGIVGAAFGGWTALMIGLPVLSLVSALVMALASAVVLVGLSRLVSRCL